MLLVYALVTRAFHLRAARTAFLGLLINNVALSVVRPAWSEHQEYPSSTHLDKDFVMMEFEFYPPYKISLAN